jgi:hypothetical protein
MSGAIPPLPQYAFMAWCSVKKSTGTFYIWNWMSSVTTTVLLFRLLGMLPNTYAYSKNITEQLVNSYSSKFPVVIARPSIGKQTHTLTLWAGFKQQKWETVLQRGYVPRLGFPYDSASSVALTFTYLQTEIHCCQINHSADYFPCVSFNIPTAGQSGF